MTTLAGRTVLLILLILLATHLPLAAQPVPERLVYKLSWTGITVGTATQEIRNDGPLRRIAATARSNAWLSLFHPVDDLIESTFDPDPARFPGLVRTYRMQMREGFQHRDREINFRHAPGTARYRDRIGGGTVDVPVPADIFDIYGSFYHIRYLPMTVGQPLQVKVLDGTEVRHVQVDVLRKERLKCLVGEVETLVVQPQVVSEGVFAGKRGVTIWLTDDQRRLPVKVQTAVAVGSVTATLKEVR